MGQLPKIGEVSTKGSASLPPIGGVSTPMGKEPEKIDQAGEAWQAVKDLISGTLDTISAFGDPNKAAELGQGIINAHLNQWKQAKSATEKAVGDSVSGRGVNPMDVVRAVGHTAAAVVPVAGPMVAGPAEDFATGHWGRGGVNTAAIVAPSVAGKLSKMADLSIGLRNPNPAAAAAVEFGLKNGVPVDAGTATGNMAIKGGKYLADRSIAGSLVATKGQAAAETSLADLGQKLAGRTNTAGPITAEGAGEGALQSVENSIKHYKAEADQHYGNLRAMEKASPQQVVSTNPDGSGLRAVKFGVDLRPVKAALKPIYDRLMKEREFSGGLDSSKSKAAMALDTLMTAPDMESLSVVDAALSDLKGLARGADMPELRTKGQGTAAQVVRQLDEAVRAAAKRGGPQVLTALEEGRAATTAKYVAADTMERLVGNSKNPEPVRIFNRLISRDDTAVNLLRDLKTQAPATIQNIGRAFLDQILGEATAEGGFKKAGVAKGQWDSLGPETKEALFPNAAHRADLDKFFHLAKMMGENPNPSGSGYVFALATQAPLLIMEPVTGTALQIGAAGLSRILRSPVTTRLLTRGLQIPLSKPASAATIIPAITKAAGGDIRTVPMPALAKKEEPKQ